MHRFMRMLNRAQSLAARIAIVAVAASPVAAAAQAPSIRSGDPVPRDIREIYDAGCRYLARAQDPSGTWILEVAYKARADAGTLRSLRLVLTF